MLQNRLDKIIDAYESRGKEQLEKLRQDVAFQAYELMRTLPPGEKIAAAPGYGSKYTLVIERDQAYRKSYSPSDIREFDEMRDAPLSKIMSRMHEGQILSIARDISRYLDRKESERKN